MKISTLKKIIKNNSEEKNFNYYNSLINKSNEISKECNFLGILMLLIFLINYVIDYSKLESIEIGILQIKDAISLKIFFPLVFTFLILRYILISAHRTELNQILNIFSQDFFNVNDKENVDETPFFAVDDFSATFLPFSIYQEFNNISRKEKSKLGCIGAIIIVPFSLILTVLPLILDIYYIYNLITNWSEYNLIQKSSIVFTIWIMVVIFYYIIHKLKLQHLDRTG